MIDLPPLDFPKPAIIRPAPEELLRYGVDPMLAIHPSVPSPAAAVGKKAAAFPVIEGFALTNIPTDGHGNFSANLPADIEAGEFLFIELGMRAGSNNPTISGWTREFSVITSDNVRFAGFSRIADGSEGATVTVGNVGSVTRSGGVVARRISGAGTVYYGSPATGDSVNPNSPSLDPGIGATEFLWLSCFAAGEGSGDDPPDITSGPSDYLDIRTAASSGSTRHARVGSAHRELNAASENPGQWTISVSREWAANTIAIAPA